MDTPQFVELLQALQSNDNTARQKAETLYQQAKQNEPDSLIAGMLKVLGNPDVDEGIRRHDAVLLRTFMTRGPPKDFVYARLTEPNKREVAAELLRRFEQEKNPKLQRNIRFIVATLAEYICDPDDPRANLVMGTNGWPDLLPTVFRVADAASNPDADSCDNALRLISDLVPTLQEDMVTNRKAELGNTLQTALACQHLKIRAAAFLLICQIVKDASKDDWSMLQATTGLMVQILMQMAEAQDEDLLQDCLQAMLEVASLKPDFFKKQLSQDLQPAKFCADLIKLRKEDDDSINGLRGMAMEWLTTFAEKKTKWLTKNLPAFLNMTLEACMNLMLEVEDGEEALTEWAERMQDDEGEEDTDPLYQCGTEAIDRVVKEVGMENVSGVLFQMIGNYANQPSWQAKHAALSAIWQVVEFVEEKSHIDEMTKLLMAHADHPHPRVRYISLLAIGQLANDQEGVQEAWYKSLMPMFLAKMDDGVDRVAAMAMSAFVSFGENLDNALMIGYAEQFMQKLVMKLSASKHRGVLEESITCIAIIAVVIEKDFSRYYDSIMPMLKQFLAQATGPKENRLRGKAFECMSLLGMAMGKEKFLPDAQEAIQEMMKTPLEADDVQREYIKEASERICQCLKKDFAAFLPVLMPSILKHLTIEDEGAPLPNPGGNNDDDDDADYEYIQVSIGEGKLSRVKTSKFEGLMESVALLNTFCTELESAFFPWVPQTAEVVLPLLSITDDTSMLSDEARGSALQTWALLIKCARAGAEESNQPPELAGKLFRTGLQSTFATMKKNTDAEWLGYTACGLVECVKFVGAGVLSYPEIKELVDRCFEFVDQSFERSKKAQKLKDKTDPGDDEEEEDSAEAEEEQCRRNYVEVVGAVMQIAPEGFMQCLPTCGERISVWIGTKENRVLALYLSCDLIEHLKQHSQSVWPLVMPQVFNALDDKDPDARNAAAYAINLAAALPAFEQAAPDAFRRLSAIVGKPKPKKRDEKAKTAYDNAVAALLSLCKDQPKHCPPEINAWALTLSRLPLQSDEDEAKKVHATLAGLVLAQHEGLLGPDRQNLGMILSILAEVYHVDGICDKPTEEQILNIFKMIPQETLAGMANQFSEKQQKKIENMLSRRVNAAGA